MNPTALEALVKSEERRKSRNFIRLDPHLVLDVESLIVGAKRMVEVFEGDEVGRCAAGFVSDLRAYKDLGRPFLEGKVYWWDRDDGEGLKQLGWRTVVWNLWRQWTPRINLAENVKPDVGLESSVRIGSMVEGDEQGDFGRDYGEMTAKMSKKKIITQRKSKKRSYYTMETTNGDWEGRFVNADGDTIDPLDTPGIFFLPVKEVVKSDAIIDLTGGDDDDNGNHPGRDVASVVDECLNCGA
jgi:hypothetical protein